MKLTQARVKEILDYDPTTGLFRWRERPGVGRGVSLARRDVGQVAGTSSHGYIVIMIDYAFHRAHRLAFLYMIGRYPKADVDHINRNRADNRWKNLREATRSQNLANGRHKNRLRGIRPLPNGKWQARISIKGSPQNLGIFDTRVQAVRAYREAAAKRWGDFHRS